MSEQTTLRNVRLWDGREDRGAVDLTFAPEGRDGAVVAIEPAADPSESEPLSVIPGLIDTHVHLVGDAASGSAGFLTWPLVTRPEERVLHGLAHAQRALAGGVTTVRDLSADDIQFSLRRGLDAGVVTGPRVLAHGMVSMTGGHGDLFTPPAVADRPPVADGPDACRALVRHWARAGADGIKIATSGGVLSVGDKAAWRNHTSAEIAAIVDEAHALGMPVAAHAHTAEGIDVALDHGVDSIEHATLLEEAQARRIVDAGLTVAPTLLINDRIAAGAGANAEQAGKAAELVERRDALLRAAADLGVDFVLGTDANGFHVRFGEQMDEVRTMARIFGWSAERALQAATSRAARAIRRADLGRVAVGGPADLLVLRGRPWERIEDLAPSAIVAVIARGRVAHGALA
ncbi:amidohydrolase family protein [Amnibacterium kyonggiense]